MSIRRLAPLVLLSLLSACAGDRSDQGSTFHLGFPHIAMPNFFGPGGGKGYLQKTAEAGTPVLLWGDTSLGDDCVPVGATTLEASVMPAHGAVSVKPGRLYAVYPEGDKHAYCSGRLVTGSLAYYTAEKDFAGSDQVVLRAVTADGRVQLVTVDITVSPARRPAPPILRRAGRAPAPAPDAAPTPLPIPKPTVRDPAAPAPTVLQTPYPGG